VITVRDRTSGDEYTDETLTCVDCGRDFVFAASDQGYYYDVLRFVCKPKRCAFCRHARVDTVVAIEFCAGKSLRELARCKDPAGDAVALNRIRRWCRRPRSLIAPPKDAAFEAVIGRFTRGASLSELAQSENSDAKDRELETIRRWCRFILASQWAESARGAS
jgi:hypothetical protein